MSKYILFLILYLSLISCELAEKPEWKTINTESSADRNDSEESFKEIHHKYATLTGFDTLYKSPTNEIWTSGNGQIVHFGEQETQYFDVGYITNFMLVGNLSGQSKKIKFTFGMVMSGLHGHLRTLNS